MKYTTMKATVSGFTCGNKAFTVTCEFELIPPEDSNHYGTGYYMNVKMPGDKHYVDVRYERTTDIEVLADRWIKDYFGHNAREVIKEFPALKEPTALIVVKTGMTKMPDNCRECTFQKCGLCCKAGKPEIKKSCLNKRHKDCPLMEVQTEGK